MSSSSVPPSRHFPPLQSLYFCPPHVPPSPAMLTVRPCCGSVGRCVKCVMQPVQAAWGVHGWAQEGVLALAEPKSQLGLSAAVTAGGEEEAKSDGQGSV